MIWVEQAPENDEDQEACAAYPWDDEESGLAATDNNNWVNQSDFSGEMISSFFWLTIMQTEDWPSKNSLSSGSETEGTERQEWR